MVPILAYWINSCEGRTWRHIIREKERERERGRD
jgi:hypothetical protein